MRLRLTTLLLGLCALFVGAPTAAHADGVTQLPFTTGPNWLAVDPAGQHVFVSGGPGSSSIVVLNFDGTIVKTITGEGGASQMALDAATHTLYVALHDATAISEIDTQTLTETTRFSTAPYATPSSLVIGGGKLWFSCTDNGSGCVASANLDGSGIASVNLQGIAGEAEATALAVGGVGNNLLALGDRYSSGGSAVAVYDISQNPPSLVSSSSNGGCPDGGGNMQDLTVDPAGANVLLACGAPYYVVSLSTSTLLPSGKYPTGAYPDAVAVSPDGKYVAGGVNTGTGGGDNAFVFSVGQMTPIRTWTLGNSDLDPHALAFSPDASRLFAIANSTPGHLEFYALDQPTVPAVETSISLTPSEGSVYAGQQVTLSAHVTGTSTGTVHLYGTPNGGNKALLATGSLASGVVSFTVSPTVTTTYSAVLDAGPGYATSTSPDTVVTVMPPAPTNVALSPLRQAVPAGNQATLMAQVTGTTTGEVDLYGTPNGGSKTLVTTGTVGSAGAGAVFFVVTPTVTTTYSAVLVAGPGYASSTSQDATVTVVPRSMSLAASAHTVTYGGQVTLTLTGAKRGTVNLFAQANGQALVLLKTDTLAAGQSSFTFTVAPQRWTAYYAERADQSTASNNAAVSVQPLLVFAVHAKRVSPQVVRRHGEKVLLGAIRKPPLPGEPLGIEIDLARTHGGWKKVAHGQIQLNDSGIVILALSVKKTGLYRARVSFTGDKDYTSARSAWRRFRVG